jgi:hypothetical protein
MRRILFTLLLVSVGFLGFAQKGSVLLYGNIGYSSEKNSVDGSNGTSKAFGFSPGVGYQIADKWTLGLNLGYETYHNGYTSKKYSVGPFVRYTKQLSEIFSLFAQIQASYSINNFSSDPTSKYINIDAFPAIELNLGKGFALNFNFGGIRYQSAKVKGKSGSYDRLNLNIGSGAGFGISKRFGTKK